jgi:hypothetical protein
MFNSLLLLLRLLLLLHHHHFLLLLYRHHGLYFLSLCAPPFLILKIGSRLF